MITLCFHTSDELLIQISLDYWQLSSNEGWTFKPAEVAKKYERSTGSIASSSRKACTIYAIDIRCLNSGCNKPLEIISRGAYESLQRSKETKTNIFSDNRHLWCDECLEKNRLDRLRQAQERRKFESELIDQWLNSGKDNISTKSYSEAPFKDAFLLYGILVSPVFDASTRRLITDNTSPKLFAHPFDTNQAYLYLYEQKWIYPCPSSEREIFEVSEDDKVALNSNLARNTNWILAQDTNGADPADLIATLEKNLMVPPEENLGFIWNWACLSELRTEFEKARIKFHFSKGWTPAVEKNLTLLLRKCSVAQAKAIVWLSMTKLAGEMQARKHRPYEVYNMMPGYFLREFDSRKAKKLLTKSFNRPRLIEEAIFTSLLFDKIIGSGDRGYENLVGSDLGL